MSNKEEFEETTNSLLEGMNILNNKETPNKSK